MLYSKKISVRELVEFVYRSGNLDSRFQSKGNAQKGTKIHQKIQDAQGIEYTSEVHLKYNYTYKIEEGEISLDVSGRADGVISDSKGITIDEIKSTVASIDRLEEDTHPVHWAQAKFYAFIYAKDEKIDVMNVRLTYVHQENMNTRYFTKEFTFEELSNFVEDTVDSYKKWLEFSAKWGLKRTESIQKMNFPFGEYRNGQRDLSVAVYKSIERKENAFIEAPTGIGKTISTLFPSIKSMGERQIQRIFFSSAKTVTQKVAQDTMEILRDEDLHFRYITITAKDKICHLEKTECNPEACQYAKGHYDRINDGVWDIINNEESINRKKIEEYSERHQICPYEYCLDISLFSDLIICDYNYLFDPRVSLKRFFENPSENYVLLVDESHNLVDRARDMYSTELSKAKIMELRKKSKKIDKKIFSLMSGINTIILKVRKNCDESGTYVDKEEIGELYTHIKNKMLVLDKWLQSKHGSEIYDDVRDVYFDLVSYLRISELYDEGFLTYVKFDSEDTIIKLFCINPANQIRRFVDKSRSSIFFTATFTPINYYKSILGGSKEDKLIKFPSAFPDENLKVFYSRDTSVKYNERKRNIDTICKYIFKMIKSKRGNYLVFFPSYSFMNLVYSRFLEIYDEDYPDLFDTIVKQENKMSDEERIWFLSEFEIQREVLGFAVMGGIFSEGIDLSGKKLIGSMIIGPGIGQINFENNLIKEYFDEKNRMGFEYAYQYPGINKVMQSAGRVIRTKTDVGIIILIDNRFLNNYYNKLLPRRWGNNITTAESVSDQLEVFWKEK